MRKLLKKSWLVSNVYKTILCFLILLGVINKVISSHLRKKNNAWFSDEIREFPDCQDLLTEIIKNTCSYGSWELIGDGIVDLALIILDINAGKSSYG